MKVYIVNVGEYSDMRIGAVFSTLGKAAHYAGIVDGYIEEFDIDSNKGKESTIYKCVKDIKSTHVDVTEYEMSENEGVEINTVDQRRLTVTVHVAADSPDSAKKKACDIFAKYHPMRVWV